MMTRSTGEALGGVIGGPWTLTSHQKSGPQGRADVSWYPTSFYKRAMKGLDWTPTFTGNFGGPLGPFPNLLATTTNSVMIRMPVDPLSYPHACAHQRFHRVTVQHCTLLYIGDRGNYMQYKYLIIHCLQQRRGGESILELIEKITGVLNFPSLFL